MNNDDFAQELLLQQAVFIEEYKRCNPQWNQRELDAYVLGMLHITGFAIRKQMDY